jgi:lipopolysaccharide export system protein LptC
VKRARYVVVAVFALAALVAGNWWMNRVLAPEMDSIPPGDSRIDYALRDFRAAFFDAEGQESLRVAGPSLDHDAVSLQAVIDSPNFVLEPDSGNWTGRSHRGVIQRDAERVTLSGDVRMSRPDRRGPLRIESERVIYDRPSGSARSPGPVRVEQAGDRLTGGSLELWIDDERMELSEDVHAIYRGAGAAAGR